MIPFSTYNQRSWSRWLIPVIYLCTFLLPQGSLFAQATTCTAKAGTVNKTSVCFLEHQTLLKAAHHDTLVPAGFQVVYLLTHRQATDTSSVIWQIANELAFVLPHQDSLRGIYTVHALVYNPTTLALNNITPGQTTLRQVNARLLQGGGTVCGSLDVGGSSVQFGACEDRCNATAGRLVASANPCLKNSEALITATVQATPLIPAGYRRLYALVNPDDGEIIRFGATPSFNVSLVGKYSIHTLVYDTATLNLDRLAERGIVTLRGIDTLLLQGGGTRCGALDKAGAAFLVEACPVPVVCQSRAGTLAVNNNPCVRDSAVVISGVVKDTSVMPVGFRVGYLLSQGTNKVVVRADTLPRFSVRDTGLYHIHTIVYNPATFRVDSLAFGRVQINSVDSLLKTLCGDAHAAGLAFQVKTCPPMICSANAGVLTPNDSICLFNGRASLTTRTNIAALTPAGYRVAYLLAATDSLVIEQIGKSPNFEVTRTGRFSIHTLVYDTTTIKLDSIRLRETKVRQLHRLLLQGGGTICGALDTTGAVFQLKACADCPAKAGKLTSNADPCFKDGKATLTVYNSEPPVVPTGFKLAYLLSQDSVVLQVSDTASFVVDTTGQYSIHTLVYDFSIFKPDSIRLGITKINQINRLFIQGGGIQCGALDVKGFSFLIIPCPIVCDARAGRLKSAGQTCVQNGIAFIEAAFDRAPIVPEGFQVRYLLVVTDLQIIRQISATPSFQVATVGEYYIHTLVYNPATYNPNTIRLNTGTLAELEAQFFNGGGDICGALDTRGVAFNVVACDNSCDASSGALAASSTFVCLANGNATLSSYVLTQPFVPAGYKVKYLLSFGTGSTVRIQQTSDNTVFRVNQTGRFTIHTLVYDPNVLTLNTILLGVTMISELNEQLIQGGGLMCAALDLVGVSFQVGLCAGAEETQLRAYPNPSTQKVNVVLPQLSDVNRVHIELINSTGDITEQWEVDGTNPNLYLDIAGQRPGVYYLRVYYDGQFVQQTSVIRAE